MSRILLALFNGIYDEKHPEIVPCWYDGLIRGLRKSGNDVLVWQINTYDYGKPTQINEEDKERIRRFQPDLCFSFNNVFPAREGLIDCPIVVLIVDSVKLCANWDDLFHGKSLVGFLQDEEYEVLRAFGADKSRLFKYRPYTAVRPDQEIKTDVNISFIGSRFGVPRNVEVGAFANYGEKAIKEYARCIDYIKGHPFSEKREIIKACHVEEPVILEHLDPTGILSLISSEKRVRVLSVIVDLGLHLYGTRTWLEKYHFDSRLNIAFVDRKVWSLKDNQDIYNHSKIGINISHAQAISGFPWRVLDILASNACLVSDYHSDYKKYFGNLHIPIYQDEFEARELCKSFLRDEEARKQIVHDSNKLIEKDFTLENMLEPIQQLAGVSFTNAK